MVIIVVIINQSRFIYPHSPIDQSIQSPRVIDSWTTHLGDLSAHGYHIQADGYYENSRAVLSGRPKSCISQRALPSTANLWLESRSEKAIPVRQETLILEERTSENSVKNSVIVIYHDCCCGIECTHAFMARRAQQRHMMQN